MTDVTATTDPSALNGPRTADPQHTAQEIAFLRSRLLIDDLQSDHPLRKLLGPHPDADTAAEAMFHLCHLASDLRTIEGVPGATGLIDALLHDIKSYANYRYELRLAGALGRSSLQRLVRLGGKGAGPDVEVDTESGARCGIACYRANGLTPNLEAAGDIAAKLVTDLAVTVGSAPRAARTEIELRFDTFPITPTAHEMAVEVFEELWCGGKPVSKNGVTAQCVSFEERPLTPWEVRIKLLVPLPAHEKQRIARKIRDKVRQEHDAWASRYSGTPVFAVEESDFTLGLPNKLLGETFGPAATHRFAAVVKTWTYFMDHEHGRRCLVERFDVAGRQGLGAGVQLDFATFGLNSLLLEKEHLVLELQPEHAADEWKLSPMPLESLPAALYIAAVAPLGLVRKLARIPHSPGVPIGDQLGPVIAKWFPGK